MTKEEKELKLFSRIHRLESLKRSQVKFDFLNPEDQEFLLKIINDRLENLENEYIKNTFN